jgi:acid stress chaperone HdeB
MRSVFFAAALVAASVFPASAERVDMSTITCGQLVQMNEDEGSFFLIWLDGWLAGQADATTMDPDELKNQIDGIAAECDASPELSVINAAKKYLEE